MAVFENGRYKYNLNSIKAMAALKFTQDLYYVHKVAYPDNSRYAAGLSLFGVNYQNYRLADARWLMWPMGPDADRYYMYHPGGRFLSLAANAYRPMDTMRVVADAMAIWDTSKPNYIDIKTIQENAMAQTYFFYPPEDRITNELAVRSLIIPPERSFLDLSGAFFTNNIAANLFLQYMPVSTIVDSFRQEGQAIIDRYQY
jgi:hypothetical protein